MRKYLWEASPPGTSGKLASAKTSDSSLPLEISAFLFSALSAPMPTEKHHSGADTDLRLTPGTRNLTDEKPLTPAGD